MGAIYSAVPPELVLRDRIGGVFRHLYRLLVGLATLAVWSGRKKDVEIVELRHQVSVLQRTAKESNVCDRDRWFLAALARALPKARRHGWLVTPDTLLRWHRRLIARHWTQPNRPPGRPSTASEIRQLIVQMATDNPTWGYRRIAGELSRLGHSIAATTIWNVLPPPRSHPHQPAPPFRGQRSSARRPPQRAISSRSTLRSANGSTSFSSSISRPEK